MANATLSSSFSQTVPQSSSPLFIFLGATGVVIPLILCAVFYCIVRFSGRNLSTADHAIPPTNATDATIAFVVCLKVKDVSLYN